MYRTPLSGGNGDLNPASTLYFVLIIPTFIFSQSSSEADWQALTEALLNSSVEELEQEERRNVNAKAAAPIIPKLFLISSPYLTKSS